MTDARLSDIGRLLRSHRVHTGRRIGQGIGVTITGAVITLIAIPIDVSYLDNANSPGFSPLPGMITGLGLVLLSVGVIRFVQSVLRPGERFDVHEHGFAHVTGRRTRTIPWPQVVALRELGSYRDDGLRHSLGLDYRCVVQLRDGTKVRFNTLTADADVLARTIDKNRA